jgi:hypothetical protein
MCTKISLAAQLRNAAILGEYFAQDTADIRPELESRRGKIRSGQQPSEAVWLGEKVKGYAADDSIWLQYSIQVQLSIIEDSPGQM